MAALPLKRLVHFIDLIQGKYTLEEINEAVQTASIISGTYVSHIDSLKELAEDELELATKIYGLTNKMLDK